MKIYIIDDEVVIKEELTKLLKTSGYECDSFSGKFENVV